MTTTKYALTKHKVIYLVHMTEAIDSVYVVNEDYG